jgi:cytochrome P450
VIRLTTHADARDAYRQKELRQALYDEGHRLMDGVIVNLHGPEHLARRRLENRLFRRDTFAWYEAEQIPAIVDHVLAPAIAAGHGDLLPLARRTMLTLSLEVAGVDREHGPADPAAAGAEIDALYELMDRLARASTRSLATFTAEPLVGTPRDPIVPMPCSTVAVSPKRTWMRSKAMPSSSLAIWANVVSWP